LKESRCFATGARISFSPESFGELPGEKLEDLTNIQKKVLECLGLIG